MMGDSIERKDDLGIGKMTRFPMDEYTVPSGTAFSRVSIIQTKIGLNSLLFFIFFFFFFFVCVYYSMMCG